MATGDEPFDLDTTLAELPPEVAEKVRNLLADADRPRRPGDPRLHHYVPQFYLRRFANANNRVGVIDLAKPKERRVSHVAKTAAVTDFYTIVHVAGHDTTIVEQILATVDDRASKMIERLAFGFIPPSEQERFDFSQWLGFQSVRGPRTRRQIEAMGDTIAKIELSMNASAQSVRDYLVQERGREPSTEEIEQMLTRLKKGEGFEIITPQNVAVSTMLKHGVMAGEFFFNRAWTLLKSREPVFLTSDDPIALHRYAENQSPWHGVGIATADEILVPLDRHTVLVAHNFADFPTRLLTIDPDAAQELNRAILHFAFAEVYGHPDDVDRVSTKMLPRSDRPLARVDGGSVSALDLPDGLNRAPTRMRPRRFRRARGVD